MLNFSRNLLRLSYAAYPYFSLRLKHLPHTAARLPKTLSDVRYGCFTMRTLAKRSLESKWPQAREKGDGPRRSKRIKNLDTEKLDAEKHSTEMRQFTLADSVTSAGLYRPLDDAGQELRVLVLLPAQTLSDPLVACLETTYLNAGRPPRFEALSYVWGAPEFTELIEISGAKRMITRNLSDALRRLRKRNIHRRLWVDALCINQDDVVEKSHRYRS
ncbi:heterokaryon incompatibility protein-domain-containing protein [Lophiotrema nucula]|uniref:Heterokaryon incompatibility protein-domain-containing protein n=1 Tax=Lophiotrema nucula TaxID=690887 RepID=A0A6A5ZTK3_9PLEO|nr:heterokaryon incompatibility protein-domain-containing protein [Lophiotrema nucula]